jgi:hypothetical protein
MLTDYSRVRYPSFHIINNALFTPIEFIFLSTFFYQIIHQNVVRKFIIASGIAFIVFWSVFISTIGYKGFDSIPTGIEFILLLSYALIYYYQQLKEPKLLFIHSDPRFWFVSTIFIFTSGTFFIFIYAETWLKNEEFINQYFLINISLLLFRNVLFGYTMLLKEKEFYLPNTNDSKELLIF